jgi:hypothetical protein
MTRVQPRLRDLGEFLDKDRITYPDAFLRRSGEDLLPNFTGKRKVEL